MAGGERCERCIGEEETDFVQWVGKNVRVEVHLSIGSSDDARIRR